MNTNNKPDTLIREHQAARLLGVKPTTLTAWRCRGETGPPFVKVGRLVRYRPADIEAFIRTNTVRTNRGRG